MKFHIVLVLFELACSVRASSARIDSRILRNLEEHTTTNVLITFKKSNTQNAFENFDSLGLTGRDARCNTMHAILKDHADVVQRDVMSLLKKTEATKKHDVRQLWISTELIVRNIDKETLELLWNHSDVESLEAEKFLPLDPVEEHETSEINPLKNQWGVDVIRAPLVWNTGNTGQGVTVASIDTGVRFTHEALRGNYRGTVEGSHDYNWFDPTGQSSVPTDTNGHGTHVTGTIVGTTNGIGVAPGSYWIHCRGCAAAGCSYFDLLECGNWVACPTTTTGTYKDCSKAPQIVNNSWSDSPSNSWYDNIISAWRRCYIVPIFSSGNCGPNCGTVRSPGDRPGTTSVGSTTNTNSLSDFSSVGPTIDGRMKPTIAAPGSAIVSASYLADDQYLTLSGTSMAAPHAAGVAALICSHRPDYSIEQWETALKNGAQPINTSGSTCGGISDTVRPNNHVGAGRIDAFSSVSIA